MRYSLYSRFRGALVGAVVGEMLGKSSLTTQNHPQVQLSQQLSQPLQPKHSARLLAESLLRLGRFDAADWRNILSKNSECRQLPTTNPAQITNKFTKLDVTFATILIALYYHDNEIKLRQNLQLVAAIGQDDTVSRDSALAVGYAIAQSLNEKLNATGLITQTITFLEPESELIQQLVQVQTLLEQGAGLERIVSELSADQTCNPIALAFYCWLSTLEDFRLSMIRSALKGEQPESSIITGALSGAYNSISGIPATLRLALSQHHTRPLAAWGMTTEAEMLELADSIVAVWSGVYDQSKHQTNLISVAAIAAPAIVRSR